MADALRHETYAGHEGSIFTVHVNEEESLDLELVDVSVKEFPGQYAFSVVFRGPSDRFFPQSSFKVEHQELGELEMFIAPINYKGNRDGIHYEFVVNRLLDEN